MKQANPKAKRHQPPQSRLAIYAFYDPDGVVSDFVVYQLQQLKQHVDRLVVVCNGQLTEAGRVALETNSDTLHLRDNQGFDIWAFRAGLIEVVGWQEVERFDEVLLLNSTFYGPIFPFSEMFDAMGERPVDFWGITAFKGPVPNQFTWQGVIPFHIQSYFMAFRKRVVKAPAFRAYWEKLPPLVSYIDAVLLHESLFTEKLSNWGFRYSVYCEPKDYRAVNPIFDLLDLLLEHRCPVLKRRAFFHEPIYLDINNVELARAISLVANKSDYDTGLIWQDITRSARPHDLYANASLLSVPPLEGPVVALPSTLRLATLAHLASADDVEVLVPYLQNIPLRFDLFCTVTRHDEVEEVRRRFDEHGLLARVKVVDSTAAESTSLLLGHREVLVDGGYDYVCRVHTVPATGTSFARERHYRLHHFENLLGSKTYVSHLLSMMEREPRLGFLVPPTLHIAHAPVRPFAAPFAETLAQQFGVKAPFDRFRSEVPTCSMFWARPEALAVLTATPFSIPPAVAADAHESRLFELSLEQLMLPAVQQSGHRAQWVFTPRNAARNYVNLEYKLQHLVGQGTPVISSAPDRFPQREVKEYLRENFPPAFAVARASFRATRSAFLRARSLAGAGRRTGRSGHQLETGADALVAPAGKRPSTARNGKPVRRVAIYMFFHPRGEVPEYVVTKLAALRAHVERIVVVCNGALLPTGREALETVADVVHVRENKGFDVWAYKTGLVDLLGWNELSSYDELILANYTFYAPIFPLAEMFETMERRDVDFWGVTSFVGPVPNFFTGDGFIPTHIQSHFIAVRKPMFTSAAFRAYWETMPSIDSYVDSVLQHETRFTPHFERQGYRWQVYSDPSRYAASQVAYEAVDLILEDRCPMLKRKPFFNDPLNVDNSNVELARALSIAREAGHYDTDLIWKDIVPVTKPRDLYTNATLFEVPDDTGKPVKLRKGIKVAVLAHVFYPALLAEMLRYARNIPVHFDLYVTTASEQKKREIAEALEGETAFTVKDIRVVENRGRDVSALLVGLRDVVLDGGYDYVCRLHSKASPQDTFGMARHFKEHLFENLLWNKAYVSRLLAMFENEPQLGIIFPPTIHIGYGTLGRSWFNNRPGADHWARELGINVPFDEHTPLCAHGSMYWFRPQALRNLFEHDFKWKDFPEEPHYADGDLPHILERLVVYCAHHNGLYGKCVLTPTNFAKNYSKLEHKFQHRILETLRDENKPTEFPGQRLKEFVLRKVASTAVIRHSFKATSALGKRL